jgi:hypothetical protein
MASPHGRGNPIEVVKRVSLSGNLAPVASWLAGSEEANAGWRNSSWFGSFYKTSTPWLYHEELGGIYAQDDGHGGVWLWHESQVMAMDEPEQLLLPVPSRRQPLALLPETEGWPSPLLQLRHE